MNRYTIPIALLLFFLLLLAVPVFAGETEQEAGPSPIRAAIFVQNRAHSVFEEKLDTLNDLITTRLAQKGLNIIDKNDVLAKFRESRISDPELARTIKVLTDVIKSIKTEAPVEDTIGDASAFRIAQMLGADYLIFVTLNSFGQEYKKFKGEGTIYGSDTEVTDYILRLALKVTEGRHGGTIYGDVVTVTERLAKLPSLEMESSNIIDKLLDAGSVKLAENITSKIEDIRQAKISRLPAVKFTVKSNVRGATVELDGAAIGSTPGKFKASPGLHQMRVSKERYATWEKTVNIYAGQVLNVTLELSEQGLRRAEEQKEMDDLLYRATKNKEGGAK